MSPAPSRDLGITPAKVYEVFSPTLPLTSKSDDSSDKNNQNLPTYSQSVVTPASDIKTTTRSLSVDAPAKLVASAAIGQSGPRRRHIEDSSRKNGGKTQKMATIKTSYYSKRTLDENASYYECNSNLPQCLVTDLPAHVCTKSADDRLCLRTQEMRKFHLPFCGMFPLYKTIAQTAPGGCALEALSQARCEDRLATVTQLDALARERYREFSEIFMKVDCVDDFSAWWSCDDCKEAYRTWICAQTLPYYITDSPLPPCRDYCQEVQNKCPYFKPHLQETYAGEPTFSCGPDQQRPCHWPCDPSHTLASYNTTTICEPAPLPPPPPPPVLSANMTSTGNATDTSAASLGVTPSIAAVIVGVWGVLVHSWEL